MSLISAGSISLDSAFKPRMLLFLYLQSTKNAPRCWKVAFNIVMTSTSPPNFSIPTAKRIFSALLEIRFPIADNCPRRRRIFEGISQDGVWTKLADNLCASQKMKAFQFIPFSWKDDQITTIYGIFKVAVLHKDDQITDNSGILRMAVTPECIKMIKLLTATAFSGQR
jgi:hypothetical protein